MTTITDHEADRVARITWSHITEPGEGLPSELINSLGAAGALAAVLDLSQRDTLVPFVAQFFSATDSEHPVELYAQRALDKWAARHSAADLSKPIPHGVQALIPGDEHWPTQLDELDVAMRPIMLWVRGDASLLASRSVAIVGARACTSYGEHVTMEIAQDLARAGITVISGASYGIDGMAHRATLAAGGKTVAVMASGVDRAYPAGNTELIELIAATGALVSELPPGSTPTKHRFAMRSLLITALSSAVVVTEAGFRSGALSTVGYTDFIERPVGAVPGPITSAASAGTNHLIRERVAVLVSSGADVLALLTTEQETNEQFADLKEQS